MASKSSPAQKGRASSSSSSSSSASAGQKRKAAEQDGAEEKKARGAGFPRGEDVALRLMSWNVNGLRACVKKGFVDFVDAQRPDVLSLGEVKCTEKEVDSSLEPLRALGYHVHWNESKSKKGYSGTAVLTLAKPLSVTRGLGEAKHDQEGRTVTAEYDDFYLVCSYVPNAGQKLDRLGYRTEEWDADQLAYLKELETRKPVVWTGDLNVAHRDIDIHNPKGNQKSAGFTPQERANFDKVLEAGFVDTFRHLHPERQEYSYWSYRFGARAKNRGWRLDYFVVSPALLPRVADSWIAGDVTGSDHCPVVMDLRAAGAGAEAEASGEEKEEEQ